MKALKYLVYLIVFLLSFVLILGLVGPKSFEVSRSLDIAASRPTVYPWIKTFANMQKWSPFLEKDANAVTSTEGTDGTVGAKNTWSGNQDVGKGSQTITNLVENELFESKLEFVEPMASAAEAYIRLSDNSSDGTTVTWGFKGNHNFIERIMFNFMNMDKMMGPEFEKGLSKLKALVESASPASSYQVTESAFAGQLYAGIRAKLKFSDISKFLADSYPSVFSQAGDKAIGPPVSVTYLWDEPNQTAEMLAAVAVKTKVPGLENISLPPGKMISVDFYGWYEDIAPAHIALANYVKNKGYGEIPPVIEEYLTDPIKEPDTAKWLTQVRYFVK